MQASTGSGGVLGFDTATDTATIAVAVAGEIVAERAAEPTPGERPRHASALLTEIEAAVAAAGGWGKIGTLAVGVGPGTFTGLRIGVATARALGQALALPIAPVVSLAALAAGLAEATPDAGRPLLASIDAKRREAFAALYDDAAAGVLWEPFVGSPEVIASRVGGLDTPPLAGGDGSLRFRDQLESAGAEVLAEDHPANRLSARHVCRLAASIAPVRPEEIEPLYLRRPDAELWRERNRD